ncbi:Unknown protein sequence [Pseudomonas syringae pv. maculicola str. M6]|nr:Unknown protein sequence [Pseudomonas syringae pv. maculicola str. M6]
MPGWSRFLCATPKPLYLRRQGSESISSQAPALAAVLLIRDRVAR